MLLICLVSSLRGTTSPFCTLPADLLRDSVAKSVWKATDDLMSARGLKTPPVSPRHSPREPPPLSWHHVAARPSKRMTQRPWKSADLTRDRSMPFPDRNEALAILLGCRASETLPQLLLKDDKRPRFLHDDDDGYDQRILSLSSTPASKRKFLKREAVITFCFPPCLPTGK